MMKPVRLSCFVILFVLLLAPISVARDGQGRIEGRVMRPDGSALAGVGVAMGNGSPATKAVADWIAPPVTEDGAAVAIERFVLNVSFP